MENDAFWTKQTNSLAGLNEFLLPVNVACAAAYAACLYVARGFIFETPRNDSGYYFLKGVVRVGDLLHHFVSNPLVRNAVGRRDSALWHPGLIVLTVLATIWSAALIIQLLIRIFFSRLRLPRLIRHMSGAAALFSAPISCVGAWFITSNWGDNYNDAAQASFGHNVLLSILGTELLIFFILSVPRRRLTLSRWARAIMLLLHFAFWSFVLFPSFIFYIGESRARILLHATTWLIPSAAAACLAYLWPQSFEGFARPLPAGKWSVITAFSGIVILLLIWLPGRPPHLFSPSNLRTTVIELSRGPCFGSCPVYALTIHGNGDVEFVQRDWRGVEHRQIGKITDRQFAEVVAVLNRAHFSRLDDRAFSWCFDTPSLAVKVSTAGQTKEVSSDSFCKGAKSGRQAAFVAAAGEIEKIVGSDRRVRDPRAM